MLAKPQMSATDPAKAVAHALEEIIPRGIRKLADTLNANHERRAALQDVVETLIAAKLALPGSREHQLDEKIQQAHAAVRAVDAEINTEAARLHNARALFEAEHGAAVRRLINPILPDLGRAVQAIDEARAIFVGINRHCARHGFSAPDFLYALPQIEFLRKMVARLSR